jgi:phosphate transport system substrate-binding protein
MRHHRFSTGVRVAGVALAFAVLAGGCAPSRRTQAITIKGSDTMVILGQRWAESYMKAHAGAVIQVTGGGSGTGIAALINGTTDICQASRAM